MAAYKFISQFLFGVTSCDRLYLYVGDREPFLNIVGFTLPTVRVVTS